MLTPRPMHIGHGYLTTSRYVRRYWVAAIGPGAVADLLRLAAAAHSGRSLPRPERLTSLLRNGLVVRDGDEIAVPDRVPPLPARLVRRLPTNLRRELITRSAPASHTST